MTDKNIFEGNRAAWNQASEYHQKARKDSLLKGFENPDFSTFNSDYDEVTLTLYIFQRDRFNGFPI